MEDSKSGITAQRCDNDSQHDGVSDRRGTTHDQQDMHRMGKQQELRRNFRFVSIFGYSMVLMATWETMLTYVYLQPLLTLPDDLAAH
jgi:choline transport protein